MRENTGNMDLAVEYARRLWGECKKISDATGEKVIIIPADDSINFYYMGIPLAFIGRKKWDIFTKGCQKYFMNPRKPDGCTMDSINGEETKKIVKQLKKVVRKNQYLVSSGEELLRIYSENLNIILDGIRMYAFSQPQREGISQHHIACCNILENPEDFDYKNQYWICGYEIAIPKNCFVEKPQGKKGMNTDPKDNSMHMAIDLLALKPRKSSDGKYELLMIEYKCTREALLKNECNIEKHCKDYLDVLYANGHEEREKYLKKKAVKAFEMMGKIYGWEKELFNYSTIEDVYDNIDINIGFLITCQPCTTSALCECTIPCRNPKEIVSDSLVAAKCRVKTCIMKYAEDFANGDENQKKEKEKEIRGRIKFLVASKPEGLILENWKKFDELEY